jgi:hypothetical protein
MATEDSFFSADDGVFLPYNLMAVELGNYIVWQRPCICVFYSYVFETNSSYYIYIVYEDGSRACELVYVEHKYQIISSHYVC